MNILVLIKQVPDMEKVKFDSEKGTVDRSSAGTEINPFDLHALEEGVLLCEKTGGKLTAISMGPPSAEDALKEAIARGANGGILLSDRAFGGSDTKATSVTIASAIKKYGEFDLVIAGEKTVDGDTGQVGAEVAEYLDIPHVSYVDKVLEINENTIKVVSNIWGGNYVKNIKLPALITVTKNINSPRLPSFKNKMAARKAVIPLWKAEDLKEFASEEMLGVKGSPTRVRKVEVPPALKREGKICRENIPGFVDEIVAALKDKKVLEG